MTKPIAQSPICSGRRSRSRDLGALIGVVAAVVCVLLVIASSSTFFDRDEARYATASLEMAHSGNHLYPTFNHELRAFQPIMVYWLMSTGLRTFGTSEVAVRGVSVAAIAGVLLLVGAIARAFFGSGVAAALIAGTCPMLLLAGSAATTDATLLFFILLAEAVFVHAWLHGPRRWHVPALGIAIGCALLTKGPVGLVVPALSIGTALVLSRGRSAAGPFAGKLLLASLIGIAIFLAWGLPANAATGGDYWRIAIAERLPKRIFTAMENHGGEGFIPFLLHLPYYPLVLLIGFLPWSLYLALAPGAFKHLDLPPAQDCWARSGSGLRMLLIGMIAPTFVLQTLIVSKLPHYIQPVFPWFAILIAASLIASRGDAFRTIAAKRMRLVFLLIAPPVTLAAIALPVITRNWPPAAPFETAAWLIALILAIGLALMAVLFWKDNVASVLPIHAVGMLALLLVCAAFVFPGLEKTIKPAQSLAREIQKQIPANISVASYRWQEPGLNFYLNARRIEHLHHPEEVAAWAGRPAPAVLIFDTADPDNHVVVPGGFRPLATSAGIDHVQGRRIQLAAYIRD